MKKPLSVAIFAQSASPGMATVVSACLDPARRVELFMPRELKNPDNEHEVGLLGLERCSGINLKPCSEAEGRSFDVLLFTWSHTMFYGPGALATLERLVPRSARVVMLYASQFGRHRDLLSQQARLWGRFWRVLRRVNLVCYMLLPPRLDLFSVFTRRVALSVGPNIHGLFEAAAQEALYRPWAVEQPRPFRLAATGGKHSDPLRAILCDAILADLKNRSDVALAQELSTDQPGQGLRVFWTMGEARRISSGEYLELLNQTDVILCLPGTSWTHRPFESLVCGAIPLVDGCNMQMHDIPWQDGLNCILVQNLHDPSCWLAAVRRALSLTREQLTAMRRNIAALRAEYLAPDAFRRRLWNKLTAV